MIVPVEVASDDVQKRFGGMSTILQLNCDRLVRAFHEKPTGAEVSVWSFARSLEEESSALCHYKVAG